jgi:hypothetical protein
MTLLAHLPWSIELFIALLAVGLVLFVFASGFGIAWLMRRDDRIARGDFAALTSDLAIHDEPQPGDVALVYRTYHGFRLWVVPTEHRYILPTADARVLLGRMLRFNLTRGLQSAAGPLVVLPALVDYARQRRAIERQEAQGECWTHVLRAAAFRGAQLRQPPALYRRIIGYMCAGIAFLMAIALIPALLNGQWQALVVLAFFGLLLGSFAYEFAVGRE